MKRFIAGLTCCILILTLASCKGSVKREAFADINAEGGSEYAAVSGEITEKRVSFFGAGDNLIHNCVYWQAQDYAGGSGYDFKPMYELVADRIENAGIAYINQETILGGEEMGLSSYPLFNSPVQLGEDMKELGFDVFSQATNHVFDKGEKGIENTYNFYSRNSDIIMTGIYKKDEKKYKVIERNDIKVAFVNYTFHTNGLSLPKDSKYMVTVVKDNDTDELIKTVGEAKKDADFVVCLIHWGDENRTMYNEIQKKTAKKLADAGCSAVIGTHPHSIQPVEFIGDTLVAYSLGNFISAQNKPVNLIGGMIEFDFVIKGNEKKIENVSFTPVINQFASRFSNIKIIPFPQYTREMALNHGADVTYDYFKSTIENTIDERFLKY